MRSRFAVSSLLTLLVASTASAFPGAPSCPDDAKKEVSLLPYARADDGPCTCATLLTCMNLDKKENQVRVQFFNPADPATQSGVDAAVTVARGESQDFGTGPDPLGIKIGVQSAGIASGELTGRVCASSSRLACDALLSCTCPAGLIWSPLQIILKKQKGD